MSENLHYIAHRNKNPISNTTGVELARATLGGDKRQRHQVQPTS